jgi:Ca2+-binding EF-hand superfamily protein
LLAAWLLPLAALAQETPAAYLRSFDGNGDGRISPAEYVHYMSAGFRQLDGNADGVLDATELPPGPRRAARTLAAFQADLRAQFRKLDRNGDGYLGARELAQPPR